MPLHDWTRAAAAAYHHFHFCWIAALMDRLNAGTLPYGYFAMAEQRVGGPEPDVITLSTGDAEPPAGGTIAGAPPRAAIVERAEKVHYARKSNRIAIHHGLGDVVAVIEGETYAATWAVLPKVLRDLMG